jgi:hypothetical protein
MVKKKKCSFGPLWVLILILLPALPVCSKGIAAKRKMEEKEEIPPQVFLLVSEEGSTNEIYISRFLLPSSLAAYGWARFVVDGDEISLQSEGDYRIISKDMAIEDRFGGFIIYRADALADEADPERVSADNRYTVTFSISDLINKKGEVFYQPSRQAVISGVKRSGRQKGSVRLVYILYLGKGKFKAEVTVR